jgi:hypothetical protein
MAKREADSAQRSLLLWRSAPAQLPEGKRQELAEALADLLLQAALTEMTREGGATDEPEDHD